MKKIILLLPLLFSVNAFAFDNPCENGCTLQQIEAINKANYKTHEQLIQEANDSEAEDYREWVEYHRVAQAKADALPKYHYIDGGQYTTCVQAVYAKATGILGDDARKHIDVFNITLDQCGFTVKEFGEYGKGCDNLAALSGIAKMGFYQEEQCRYQTDRYQVYLQYKDVMSTPGWTPSVDASYYAALKPIDQKHEDIVVRLHEREEAINAKSK